jgi:ABC-type phosphate/phosphonate transport system substrate-binding protein
MSGAAHTLLLGAVAYDPKVVTIWNGFRQWFMRDQDQNQSRNHGEHPFAFDYVLYSHYERQVQDLLDGRIDVAWNSPLAWVRARRLAEARGAEVTALLMRDTDQDLTSVVVVRADSPIHVLGDLRGKNVGTGAVDSPQATLLPLAYIRTAGLEPGADFSVRRFDVGVGLHGDHVGGEREAARALVRGEVDAACMIDGNHLAFRREGTLPSGSTRVLGQTALFDHCNMTVSASAPRHLVERFKSLLLGMSYADPELRPLLDLEGLKAWREGRTSGYAPLERAVDDFAFYDGVGSVTARDYRP